MTPLREQLDHARDHYAAQKYPGDLATDVLDRHRPSILFRLGAASAALAGLAAAVAVWVATRPAPPSAQPATPSQVALATPTTSPSIDDVASSLSGLTSVAEFPESVPLSPGASFETSDIGSMPAMPSMDL